MKALVLDLRHAARSLSRRPALCVCIVLTLGLGIGATSAIFALVHGVVLQQLPFRDADRLVRLMPDQLLPFEKPVVLAIEEHEEVFSEVAAWGRQLFLFDGEAEPEEVRGGAVFANHFSMLGAKPFLGRWFLAEDGEVGAPPVMILSEGLWRRKFGADPSTVGSTISVNGTETTVVGVMASHHQPMESDWQAWSPVTRDPEQNQSNAFAANARLAPGISVEQANEALRQIAIQLWTEGGRSYTDQEVAAVGLTPLKRWILGDVDRPLLFLLIAVALVFLLACANVSHLLLAIGDGRAQDLAVRRALGAGRGRLAGLVMMESTLLALGGGVLGCLACWWILTWSAGRLPVQIPRTQNVGIDLGVLGFGLMLAVVSALLFGLLPALRVASREVGPGLGLRTQATGSSRSRWRQNGLVIAEVAIAAALVIGAGLVLRSLHGLSRTDPGFVSDGVVVVRASPSTDRYGEPEQVVDYYRAVEEALRAVPGVATVGGIQFLPMTPGGWWSGYRRPDQPTGEGTEPPRASMRVVTRDYFRTLAIPLLAGGSVEVRGVEEGAPLPVVVNRTLAEQTWPGEEALGRRLVIGDESESLVVGVVGDVRQRDLGTESTAEIYIAHEQVPWQRMWIAARFSDRSAADLEAIKTALRSVDGEVVLSGLGPLGDIVGGTLADSRFFASLLTAFAGLALLLGAVGIYGVASYAVERRRHEIGVRLALGASPRGVVRSTVGAGLVPVATGLLLGVCAAVLGNRLLAGLLHETSPRDPLTFATVVLLLLAVAGAALLLPARRAAGVDPLRVLTAS